MKRKFLDVIGLCVSSAMVLITLILISFGTPTKPYDIKARNIDGSITTYSNAEVECSIEDPLRLGYNFKSIEEKNKFIAEKIKTSKNLYDTVETDLAIYYIMIEHNSISAVIDTRKTELKVQSFSSNFKMTIDTGDKKVKIDLYLNILAKDFAVNSGEKFINFSSEVDNTAKEENQTYVLDFYKNTKYKTFEANQALYSKISVDFCTVDAPSKKVFIKGFTKFKEPTKTQIATLDFSKDGGIQVTIDKDFIAEKCK